jgi:hypothetical protein
MQGIKKGGYRFIGGVIPGTTPITLRIRSALDRHEIAGS